MHTQIYIYIKVCTQVLIDCTNRYTEKFLLKCYIYINNFANKKQNKNKKT